MPVVRRARAFTLIETMIVVAMVGVLAVVATVAYRKWIRNSYTEEAADMLGNIRSAEENFRAENSGYLSVSNDLNSLYPATLPTEAVKTEWGGNCTGCVVPWAALNVAPSGAVRFGYAVVAANDGSTPADISINGTNTALTPMGGAPWYVAKAVCDVDNDTTTDPTTIYALSGNNRLIFSNEGQ